MLLRERAPRSLPGGGVYQRLTSPASNTQQGAGEQAVESASVQSRHVGSVPSCGGLPPHSAYTPGVRWLLPLSILLCSGCGNPADGDSCPWFVQCGTYEGLSCAGCDDGDSCTADTCDDGFCRHIPTGECCTPRCDVPDGGVVHVQTLMRGTGGLPGPLGPRDVIATSDQAHVYVAATRGGQVVHLVRDSDLRWGEAVDCGGPEALALSPDERVLYAAGAQGLVVAERAEDTGRVIPRSLHEPAFGLLSTPAALLSVDGTTLRSWTHPEAGGFALTPIDTATDPALAGARSLVAVSDSHVAVAGFGTSVVSLWRLADLGYVGAVSEGAGLDHPSDVVFDDGRVYVAGYCDHDVAILRVEDNALLHVGALWGTEAEGERVDGCTVVQPEGDPSESEAPEMLRLEHPTALAITGDGRLAVAGKSLAYEVILYDIEGDTLVPSAALSGRPPVHDYSDQPFHLVPTDLPDPFYFQPTEFRTSAALRAVGDHLYAASELSNFIASIVGARAEQFVQRGDGGITAAPGAYNVDLSGDGKHLYVAGRTHGVIGAFAVGEGGALTEVVAQGAPDEILDGAMTNVGMTKDGTQVLAVDAFLPFLNVYDRHVEAGTPTWRYRTPIPDCDGGPALAVDVMLSPDDRSVYVADFQDKTKSCIVAWQRAADGTLGEPVRYDDAPLAGIESIVLTRDGAHLYAASFVAASVAHYRRGDDGGLTAQDPMELAALHGAEFLALSPDETHLYVTSPVTHRLLWFLRDADGTLTYGDTLDRDDAPLKGAAGLAVSSDGRFIYVAARLDNAVNVFEQVESELVVHRQAITGLPGLVWANGIALTPDDKVLLTSAVAPSAVSSFRVIRAGQDGCGGTCP